MRGEYAAKEISLEMDVYEILEGNGPEKSQFPEFEAIPSELPLLDERVEYVYIINLDQEILTMNYGTHWKLDNIPRQDNLEVHLLSIRTYS